MKNNETPLSKKISCNLFSQIIVYSKKQLDMSNYKIKIKYITGDSFNSENAENFFELTWNNIDVAKENLQRIKEHYEMYTAIEERFGSKKNTENWFEKNKDKDWFVSALKAYCVSKNYVVESEESKEHLLSKNDLEYRLDKHSATYLIKIKADNGNEMQFRAFWIGHFEQLLEAEIIADDSDMRISFY